MFDGLQNLLLKSIRKAGGRGRLSAEELKAVISGIRMSLLEADVHFQVAKNFCEGLRRRLEGSDIHKTLTPEQTILMAARDEMTDVLGARPAPLSFAGTPKNPDILMLVGLYGVGKTTYAAKLGAFFQNKMGRRPLLVSSDAQRPAAHEQIARLAGQAKIACVAPPAKASFDPVARIKDAIREAKKTDADIVIVDTAGRSALAQDLIAEIQRLVKKISPRHVWLVLDAMLGQSSIQVARAFHEACALTGNVITKCDSDARGGVALSATLVTGKPVYFVGIGERVGDCEPFDPAKMASRILDLGDLEGLFEKAAAVVPEQSTDRLMAVMQSGEFSLEDFRNQLGMFTNMDSVAGWLKMIPGMGGMLKKLSADDMDRSSEQLKKFRAMIDSMTPRERKNPRILSGSRRARIARGSGTSPQDVNTLMRQYEQMKKMIKGMGQGQSPFPGMLGKIKF